MSDLGYVEAELQGLSEEKDKPILKRVFREILRMIAFGPVNVETGQAASTNHKGHLVGPITMPAIANTEIAIPHRFASTPYLAIPILPNETGAQIVPLTWTRAWDSRRIYLSSSVASARVFLYIEGMLLIWVQFS